MIELNLRLGVLGKDMSHLEFTRHEERALAVLGMRFIIELSSWIAEWVLGTSKSALLL
jgi:hypothetical protein